ncbi:85/88 kDa calcium-independent phospholipase A2 [Halotydeus destructor]|nr:85/88 kDa calcium-independent phospholipase A2 [Halotydeus destructor]
MDFLREYIGNLRKKPISEYPVNQVVEVKAEDYVHHIPFCRDDSLLVYGLNESQLYEIVYQRDVRGVQTAYSLCRSRNLNDAEICFRSLVSVLVPITNHHPALITQDSLQEMTNYMREHPNQSLAHIASAFNFTEVFKPTPNQNGGMNKPLVTDVNVVCPDTQQVPLHLAVKNGKMQIVQFILSLGPKFDLVDNLGNNVLHHAAGTSREIIATICNAIQTATTSSDTGVASTNDTPDSREQSPAPISQLVRLINARNSEAASPLHLACLADKPDCVKELLKNGAEVNGACIEDSHGATRSTASSPVDTSPDNVNKSIDKLMVDQLDHKDMKNGGNPLHWAKSPQCMQTLIEMGCNIDAKNFGGETVLHVMVNRIKLPCIVTLLSYGADVNARGPNGNTPLHLAVKNGDVPVVQALVVFGAKLDVENASGETARHLAATQKRSAGQDMILYVLHTVQASRCTRTVQAVPCAEGCAKTGNFNGVPPENAPFKRIQGFYDMLLGKHIVKDAAARKRKLIYNLSEKTSPDEEKDISKMEVDDGQDDTRRTVKLLCLDGGGIRGLILIQMLSVLEDRMGVKISESFDWIAGTSTGGILALVLASGHTSAECRQFYFRMKDKVFGGNRPYESDPLDKFLQKTLGEETTMADIVKPRVMVTATLADRFPADLHLFRNYESPNDILEAVKMETTYPLSPKPATVKLWAAARSSGAAPTYFRPNGQYLDGGLIANNPTLDILTEITYINNALQLADRASEKVDIDVVVSLGTGSGPVHEVPIIDVFRPDSLFGVAKIAFMASSLGQLLVDQASQADGQVVERAKAWCNSVTVPYFRLNPPVSDNIQMDETSNVKLLHILWETTAYMLSRKEEFDDLALLLQ